MSAPRASSVSLGCPKALLDSERSITNLRSKGYVHATTHPKSTAVFTSSRARPLRVGDIVAVKIEASAAYDLHAVTT